MVESVVERDELGGDEWVGGVAGGDCDGVEWEEGLESCDALRERDEFAMVEFQHRYSYHHSLCCSFTLLFYNMVHFFF